MACSRIFALCFCVLCVLGCSRECLKASRIVASVSGKTLKMCELNARASNVALLYCHKSGSTNAYEKIRSAFSRGYAKVWVEDMVLADAAAKDGVEPSVDLLAKYRNQAFQNFKAKGDKSFADLLVLPGFDADLMEKQVRSEALRVTMKEHWAKLSPANLPSTYADDTIRKISEQNAAFAISNRLQWAKATNVWEQLKSGADFGKTARAHTELNEEAADNGEWAVVDAKFLSEEPKLLKWLKAAKPGEFSPPLAADNGVMIAHLDHLEEEEGFAVSRIFFHLAEIRPPAPAAEIVAAAQRKHAEALFVRKLAELVEGAKAVYSQEFSKENKKEVK